MYIVAFDPGKTTGVVKVKVDTVKDPEIILSDDIYYYMLHKHLEDLVKDAGHVVIEDVIQTGSLSAGKVAQIIAVGMIEYECLKNNITYSYVPPNRTKNYKYVPEQITMHHAKDAWRVYMAWVNRPRS